jgi:hypothetical protein
MPATQNEGASATPHILTAIRAVMAEVTFIPKTGQYSAGQGNKKTEYKFRKFEDTAAALGASFRNQGIFVQSRTISSRHATDNKPYAQGAGYTTWTSVWVEMAYTFTSLVDGSELTSSAFGEGKDSSDKATAKAMTTAMKAALTQAFMLPTDDPDPESQRPGDDHGDFSQPTGQGRGPSNQGQQQRPPQNRPAGPPPPAAQSELTQAEQRHANAAWFVQAMNQPNVDLARLNELIGLAKGKGLLGYQYEGVPLQVRFTAAGGMLGKQTPPAGNEFPPEPEGLY